MPNYELNDFRSASEVVSLIGQYALTGDKVPHRISQPVLRMHNGKPCIATFVFFFNYQHLQTARVPRPSMWIVSDLQTGELIKRYECKENEFSFRSYEKLYDLAPGGEVQATKQYMTELYALLDEVRNELMQGQWNAKKYQTYLSRLCKTIPPEYQVFYKDLSRIDL